METLKYIAIWTTREVKWHVESCGIKNNKYPQKWGFIRVDKQLKKGSWCEQCSSNSAKIYSSKEKVFEYDEKMEDTISFKAKIEKMEHAGTLIRQSVPTKQIVDLTMEEFTEELIEEDELFRDKLMDDLIKIDCALSDKISSLNERMIQQKSILMKILLKRFSDNLCRIRKSTTVALEELDAAENKCDPAQWLQEYDLKIDK